MRNLYICLCLCIYVYMYKYIYIYIYIYISGIIGTHPTYLYLQWITVNSGMVGECKVFY